MITTTQQTDITMIEYPSTTPTTRSEFNARLLSLSTRNEELEERLREAERNCQRHQIKSSVQQAILSEFASAIHSMAQQRSPGGSSNDANDDLPEEIVLLLSKNARQIANLTATVEEMKTKLQSQDQIQIERRNFGSAFVEISLSEDDDEKEISSVSTSSTSSMSSSSEVITIQQKSLELEQEIDRVNSKCSSLERSLATLKRSNTIRQVRNSKSLQNMRRQIDSLEEERKRRLHLQTEAEERAIELEVELHQLKEKGLVNERNQETQSRKPDPPSCRNVVMLRNQLLRGNLNSPPPILLSVSEDSESSEDSDEESSLSRSRVWHFDV